LRLCAHNRFLECCSGKPTNKHNLPMRSGGWRRKLAEKRMRLGRRFGKHDPRIAAVKSATDQKEYGDEA
jgi:hypothetical protein